MSADKLAVWSWSNHADRKRPIRPCTFFTRDRCGHHIPWLGDGGKAKEREDYWRHILYTFGPLVEISEADYDRWLADA